MTLAPIRGAPPGASIPDFPTEEPKAGPPRQSAAPPCGDQSQAVPQRRRYTPVEIGGDGVTLTFTVVPEIPAIMRASMTVHVIANPGERTPSHTLGFLRMSTAKAKEFLTDLRAGRSPIIAIGDEDGTVQIEYENTASGPTFCVHEMGQRKALRRCVMDPAFDITLAAAELLADLGE